MNITSKEEQSKDNFVKMLKGKQVPRDMFGAIIQIGDILVYGSGSQSASGLNFARVYKINYNGTDRETGEEKLSSVTIQPIQKRYDYKTKVTSWSLGKKIGMIRFTAAWVLKDIPPVVREVIERV